MLRRQPNSCRSGLTLAIADHMSTEAVQEFLQEIMSPPKRHALTQTSNPPEQRQAQTQTDVDCTKAGFSEELLRCVKSPDRLHTNRHLMQTVRRLSVLHQRRNEQLAKEQPRTDSAADREAWSSCLRAVVSAEAKLTRGSWSK